MQSQEVRGIYSLQQRGRFDSWTYLFLSIAERESVGLMGHKMPITQNEPVWEMSRSSPAPRRVTRGGLLASCPAVLPAAEMWGAAEPVVSHKPPAPSPREGTERVGRCGVEV